MQSLERAIRIALEVGSDPLTQTVFASGNFESTEFIDKFEDTTRRVIHYEASFKSKSFQVQPSNISNINLGSTSDVKKNPRISCIQKAARYSKPEYVYWIHNEVEKW